MTACEDDPKKKPGQTRPEDAGQTGGNGNEQDRKQEARAEDGGDDDEEFPDLYNEKDPDFDDPDEQEFP